MKGSRKARNIWPRIADIARWAEVKPVSENSWPLIGAYDEAGNFYDVEEVMAGMRRFADG